MLLKGEVAFQKKLKKGEDFLNDLNPIDPGGTEDAWDIKTTEKKDQAALFSSTLKGLEKSRTIITNLFCFKQNS